jgi:hypothetical protein
MVIRAFALSTALLFLLARPAWAASELMLNFVDMPIKTASGVAPSPVEVHDAIVNAASMVPARPWSVTDAGPGKLIGRLQTGRRGHVVVVEILYSPQVYSVNYLNSSRMNYRAADRTIHTSYNVWVSELVESINRRLSTLAPTAVPLASASAAASVPAAAPTPGMPQVGDIWTYRATRIWRRGEIHSGPTERTYVVRVAAVSETEIVEELAIDGVPATSTTHTKGAYLISQGVSIFSPHLALWGDLSQPASLGGVEILDPGCKTTHICQARARIVGTENIRVVAGTFAATRILVEQSWQSGANSAPQQAAQMSGSRTLAVWYSPQVKRAIKYSSRVKLGDVPPIDPHFDLELVSYQLK